MRESLREIHPQPLAANEPSEVDLRALYINLPPRAFLKVTQVIEAAMPDEAAHVLRKIADQMEHRNQPKWWFVNALPIEIE